MSCLFVLWLSLYVLFCLRCYAFVFYLIYLSLPCYVLPHVFLNCVIGLSVFAFIFIVYIYACAFVWSCICCQVVCYVFVYCFIVFYTAAP